MTLQSSLQVRSQALKLVAAIFRKYPAYTDYADFWNPFLEAVQPLLPRLLVEVSAERCALLCYISTHVVLFVYFVGRAVRCTTRGCLC